MLSGLSHVVDKCDMHLFSFLAGKMSLFDCGFYHISRSENSETDKQSIVTPPHFPSVDSGLGRLEYDEVVANHQKKEHL